MGRRQRKAERVTASRQSTEESKSNWVYGRRAAEAAFALLVLGTIATVLQLSP